MAVGSGRAHQVTFAVLSLGVAAFALLQSLVVPVLTTVQHELHTTQSAATWVLTAYLLSASIMTPILGRIGDMIGKERVFVATLVALAAGSLLPAGGSFGGSSK
jgi:MFS family permease